MSPHDPLSLTRPPSLPNEIIFSIISSLLPSNRHAIAILPSDPITKTLLSLTLTSRLTYPIAMRLLYSHCLYIDTFYRLENLHRTLRSARFPNSPHANHPQAYEVLQLPLHSYATSLYLSPFQGIYITHIDEITSICDLLTILAPHLKRLILSFTGRNMTHSYEEWTNNLLRNSHLYNTLAELKSLEVFCTPYEESGLVQSNKDFTPLSDLHWANWPNLRVLALNGPSIGSMHLKWMSSREKFERLVLVCFGSIEWRTGSEMARTSDLKDCYEFGRGENEQARRVCGMDGGEEGDRGLMGRKQEICWVDPAWNNSPPFFGEETWDVEDRLQVRVFKVPGHLRYDREDPYITCGRWTEDKFVSGDEAFLG